MNFAVNIGPEHFASRSSLWTSRWTEESFQTWLALVGLDLAESFSQSCFTSFEFTSMSEFRHFVLIEAWCLSSVTRCCDGFG